MKFCPRVRPKRWNDRNEFEYDRARRNNNIAINSFLIASQTHSSYFL